MIDTCLVGVGVVGVDYSDQVVGEGYVAAGEFGFGHVAGGALFPAYGAGLDGG